MATSKVYRAKLRRNKVKATLYREDIEGLRHLGLSCEAIAKALWWYRGATITGNQVNYALAVWGEQPAASMVRAGATEPTRVAEAA